jgi:hypothetical protein
VYGTPEDFRMNTELMGMTREHAMRLAADLTISARAEQLVELLWRAQLSALVEVHGERGAREIVSERCGGKA